MIGMTNQGNRRNQFGKEDRLDPSVWVEYILKAS